MIIKKKWSMSSYNLDLPLRFKLHLVFHVKCLKPYQEKVEVSTHGESKHTPLGIITTYDKEVEEILADRVIR